MGLQPVIGGSGFYNKSSGGVAASFATLTGVPADNAALVTALALKANLAGGNTFTSGAQIINQNGAASAPSLHLNGTVFTGGSATTTKPLYLIEPTGTTSTGWSTSGTLLGVNAPSGFAGSVLAAQVNAVNVFDANRSLITCYSGVTKVEIHPAANALYIKTNTGDAIQLNNTRLKLCQWAQSNYYIQSPDGGPGNANRATGNLNIHTGISTGSGVGGSLIFGTSNTGASGTAENAIVDRLTINESGVIVASGVALRLGNTASAGAVIPTHTITVQDSTGTTYRIPCLI